MIKKKIKNFLKRILKPIYGGEPLKESRRLSPMFSTDNVMMFFYFDEMLKKVASVEGDVVECGIGRGRSFHMFGLLLNYYKNTKRKLWGFDSFEGFPAPTPEDASPRNPQKVDKWKKITVEEARRAVSVIGLSEDKRAFPIEIVDGFLDDTLPKAKERISQIALLHLDVDLYGSYKTCLEQLFPKVAKGGIVLFDEYVNTKEAWPGAVKAIDDYFKNTPYKPQLSPISGRYFVVKE